MKLGCYLNNPLGLSPQGIPKKEIIPAIIGAVAAVAAGAIAASSASSAQKKTNQSIADTNQLNYKIHKEDQQFALDQYNRQLASLNNLNAMARKQSLEDREYENAYNSPAAQRLRFQQAGINPFLALDNAGAVGSVQAQTIEPSVPNAQLPSSSPAMQPLHYDGQATSLMSNSVLSSISQFAAYALKKQELDDNIIKAVLNNPELSPEERNELIRTRKFRRSRLTDLIAEAFESKLQGQMYDDMMKEVMLNWQQELIDEERREFARKKDIHVKFLKKADRELDNLFKQGKLLDSQGQINENVIKRLEKEAKEIQIYENDMPGWLKKFFAILRQGFGGSAFDLIKAIK